MAEAHAPCYGGLDWRVHPFSVVELRLGHVGRIPHGQRSVRSAIAKARTPGPVALGPLGFAGDAVADTKNHGGVDKAVCVYAASRYPEWTSRLGTTLARPAFGENLLVAGVDEDDVHVGDVFALGTAVLAVSQPRVPCYKPAAHTGERRLTLDLRRTGWTGWYLRVLEPGVVREGDAARPRQRLEGSWSVAALNALRYGDAPDPGQLAAAADAPGLTDGWREALRERMN
jgi:MOSC domain-containing protein YiiM